MGAPRRSGLFTTERAGGLKDVQRIALMTGEDALEALPFRDRDAVICAGYARRKWPDQYGGWRTWLTPAGAALRARLTGFEDDEVGTPEPPPRGDDER